MATQRGQTLTAALPQSFGTPAATKAAYRFCESDVIDPATIRQSHYQQTATRVAGAALILAVQDTTILDYSHHPATTGLGVLNDTAHHGLLVHSTLAVTPQRVPLGLVDQQVWARPAAELGKAARRRQRPTSAKESQKWLTALTAVARLQAQQPTTRFISVGDREADIYDLFWTAHTLGCDLLVRASWDRRVAEPEHKLWARLAAQPVGGQIPVAVPRHEQQPARTATLTVRWAAVTVRPPRGRKLQGQEPLAVWAVWAQEDNPPPGVPAISWRLLTTVAVASLADAGERLAWYACRWVVELYHKVLKSGCRVEERQFARADTIERYLSLDSVVAWRALYLTLLGREAPELPCDVLLAVAEWQALYCFIHQTAAPPATPPTLAEATRWLAQLGGFQGRKGDGAPGSIVLWRGLQRLPDITATFLIFRRSAPDHFP